MKFIYPFVLLSIAIHSYAQVKTTNPLSIGDTIPNLQLLMQTGDSTNTVKLADYKQKVVILDFWSTSCLTCIELLPEMLALQEAEPDKLKIIIVTPDSGAAISHFWAKLGNRFPTKVLEAAKKLPFLISDTILSKLFPYTAGLPMHVWIDVNAVYRASALPTTTNIRNVQAFFNGQPVIWNRYHQATLTGPLSVKSWLDNRIGFRDHLLFYSLFSKFDESISTTGPSVLVEKDTLSQKNIGILAINKSIYDLYNLVYLLKYPGTRQRYDLIFELHDSTRYVRPKTYDFNYITWQEKNMFSYVLKLPSSRSAQLSFVMQRDLDLYFQVNSKLEVRRMKCLILKKTTSRDKIRSKGGISKTDFRYSALGRILVIRNMPNSSPLSLFRRIEDDYFIKRNRTVPFLDETNYNNNIDVELAWGLRNFSISLLRRSLRKYDLDIVEAYRYIPVLVVKESSSEYR